MAERRAGDLGNAGAGPAEAGLRRRIARHLALARLTLAAERAWRAIWPAQAVVALFAALALLDFPSLLGPIGHSLLLALLAGAVLFCLGRGIRRFDPPDAAAAERRVETASGLAHRPLAALRDRPAIDDADPAVAALWAVHLRRTAARLRWMRSGWMRAGVADRDPVALRAAVALALVLGIAVAGETGWDRLGNALRPAFAATGPERPVVDLWVEPPAYTGLPPVLARADKPSLTFPTGSTLVARVRGGRAQPDLVIDAAAQPFATIDGGAFEIKTPVLAGSRLAIRQGRQELAAWPIVVTPDNPPTATLPKPPTATPRAAMRIDYAAEDDYGLASLRFLMRRVDAAGDPVGDEVLELPVAVAGEAKTLRGADYRDLAAHEWAGRTVELVAVALDGADQEGRSEPLRFTLPERQFTHPIARLIVEERKKLDHAPAARREVGQNLMRIAGLTEMYDSDTAVFLALSMSRARLRFDEEPSAIPAVRDLLWDVATRLEDGSLSTVEREMRAAQQALNDALARQAPRDEIDKLIDQLRAAMERYMRELMANAEDGDPNAEIPPDAQVLDMQDMENMLEQLRQALRSGDREKAMQLMAQLQQMLEALRNARAMRQPGQGNGEMSETMRQFQDLAQQQRSLLDRTFRQQQQRRQRGQPGQQGQDGQAGQLGAEQERLRRMLGDVMRRLGEQMGQIPGQLGRAEQAMRDAIGALDRDAPGDALGPQSNALDQLQQAGRQIGRELARQMGQGDPRNLPQDQNQPPNRDPLGRESNGLSSDTNNVGIPAQGEIQRARRIWDELQRRAGERARPGFERDYLDRLLKSF